MDFSWGVFWSVLAALAVLMALPVLAALAGLAWETVLDELTRPRPAPSSRLQRMLRKPLKGSAIVWILAGLALLVIVWKM
jgi:hypothetical protein